MNKKENRKDKQGESRALGLPGSGGMYACVSDGGHVSVCGVLNVYCSVLQCVAVCCSVLQCVAVCSSVRACVCVWCSECVVFGQIYV